MGKIKFFILLLIITFWAISPLSVYAQDQPAGPTYTIQPGDTLNVISLKFGISIEDIISINNIQDPNLLSAGQALIIPGLEGVTGNLTAETIPLGANLSTLSIQYQFPLPVLSRLNKITSPLEVFAGSSLILPLTESITLGNRTELDSGKSLLYETARIKSNPWVVIIQNNLDSSWQAIPSQPVFYSTSDENVSQASSPIPMLTSLQLDSLPLVQGQTVEIIATGEPGLQLNGSLNGYELHFFPMQDGEYYALQGIHAMSTPGLTNFELNINKNDTELFEFSQMVYLQSRNFPEDPPLAVDPLTIDPQITKPEEDQISQLISIVSPQKQWDGVFSTPVDEPCIKSWYGNRRSYNGGPYSSFHTGNDYGVCAPNFNIYAAAAGTVVFAGPLTVRGNATIIDHGQGIFSGYWHQKEIGVQVGEQVKPGQLIGQIGATGRVSGPHLHFEVWVNGVQVEPSIWLEKAYP